MNDAQKEKKRVELVWWILEQKLFYYHPEYGKCVDDTVYDKKELEYISYCTDLGLKPTACNNVGFPWDTPSGRLVASKYFKKEVDVSNDAMKIVTDFENELEGFLKEIENKRPIN